MDILIIIPKTTDWSTYQKELKKAENGEVMNFKVPTFPKNVEVGDRCYIVYDGSIIGWMQIVGLSEKSFVCTTTGNHLHGKFIERSGKFNRLPAPVPYAGFQGFRYLRNRP